MQVQPPYDRTVRSDRRNRRALIWLFAAALGGAGIAANAITAPSGGSATSRANSLLPDRSAVRYRFASGPGDARAADDDAIRILERRAAGQPSPLDLADLAELYYRRAHRTGDEAAYEAAGRYARQSLAILDTPNRARLTLAKLANARHEFRGAVELAQHHLATRGGDARGAHVVIATARLALGDLDGARAAANAALAILPDSNGYLTRALVMEAAGRVTDAAPDFARAASAEQAGDPEGAGRLRALWARFLIRRAAYREAAIVLDEAQRIAPDLAIVLAQRGELALGTGRARDAARLFERAFERERQVRYLLDEARARELAGERDNAERLRERVETIVRGDPRAHRKDLIEVLVARGTPAGIAEAMQLRYAEMRSTNQ